LHGLSDAFNIVVDFGVELAPTENADVPEGTG